MVKDLKHCPPRTEQEQICELYSLVFGLQEQIDNLPAQTPTLPDIIGNTPIGSPANPVYYDGESLRPITPTWAGSSWETIALVLNQGEAATYFHVGDQRKITFGNAPMILTIVGINADELADGSGKAGITVEATTMPADLQRIQDPDNNQKNITQTTMYTKVLPEYISMLPIEAQPLIKSVIKKAFYQNTTTLNNYVCQAFTPSIAEIYSAAALVAADMGQYSPEGVQYEYYKQLIGDASPNVENTKLLKYAQNTTAAQTWWTRTIVYPGTTDYYYMATGYQWNGRLNGGGSHNLGGVSFMFCM